MREPEEIHNEEVLRSKEASEQHVYEMPEQQQQQQQQKQQQHEMAADLRYLRPELPE